MLIINPLVHPLFVVFFIDIPNAPTALVSIATVFQRLFPGSVHQDLCSHAGFPSAFLSTSLSTLSKSPSSPIVTDPKFIGFGQSLHRAPLHYPPPP